MPDFAIPTASGHACHGTSDLDAESMCLEGYGVLQNALLLVSEKALIDVYQFWNNAVPMLDLLH